jgi:hypothetical protein
MSSGGLGAKVGWVIGFKSGRGPNYSPLKPWSIQGAPVDRANEFTRAHPAVHSRSSSSFVGESPNDGTQDGERTPCRSWSTETKLALVWAYDFGRCPFGRECAWHGLGDETTALNNSAQHKTLVCQHRHARMLGELDRDDYNITQYLGTEEQLGRSCIL